MIRTRHTLGRSDESRCSICRHPDREAIDQDLVLKQMTQAEAALRVGVHRSTVSRHVKNHVRPALVQGVLMETKDVAIGSIAEAFDRNYAQSQVLYERAVNRVTCGLRQPCSITNAAYSRSLSATHRRWISRRFRMSLPRTRKQNASTTKG